MLYLCVRVCVCVYVCMYVSWLDRLRQNTNFVFPEGCLWDPSQGSCVNIVQGFELFISYLGLLAYVRKALPSRVLIDHHALQVGSLNLVHNMP